MVIAEAVKSLPGPDGFYGLKNVREMGQKGILSFIGENWQKYGDLFEVRVGPKRLVMIIHLFHAPSS